MAAKRTADLIPLCHPLPLTHVDVDLVPRPRGYRDRARASGRSAAPASRWKRSSPSPSAALTLYDMLKAVDRAIVIGPIRLREKRGGRSGSPPPVDESSTRSRST